MKGPWPQSIPPIPRPFSGRLLISPLIFLLFRPGIQILSWLLKGKTKEGHLSRRGQSRGISAGKIFQLYVLLSSFYTYPFCVSIYQRYFCATMLVSSLLFFFSSIVLGWAFIILFFRVSQASGVVLPFKIFIYGILPEISLSFVRISSFKV